MRQPQGPPAWRQDFHASPLFAGLADVFAAFADCREWPDPARLDRLADTAGVRNARGLPVRFITQTAGLGQAAYERLIHGEGTVPTRPANWHDFFNALIWLAYPRTKAGLNAAQQQALAEPSATGRVPRADALTLFDESGLVLVGPHPELAAALRARQWLRAFWELRPLWRQSRLRVIGHSLLEKALDPFPGITGKCLYLEGEADLPRHDLDRRLAAVLAGDAIRRPADLFPLPVCGVPGYHPGNGVVHFYADTRIFRPLRC
jgi:hypothetical protein